MTVQPTVPFLPLLLMIALSCSIVDETKEHCIKPYARYQNFAKDCYTFDYCLKHPKDCFKSDYIVYFLPGVYFLTSKLLISNITNFSLLVMYNQTAVVSCRGRNKGYIAIDNSANISMQNIVIKACGADLNKIKVITFPIIPVRAHTKLASAMVLNNCNVVQLSNILYNNNYGHALLLINVKHSNLNNITFSHSKFVLYKETVYAGMLVYFEKLKTNVNMHQSEKVSLSLLYCQFLNYTTTLKKFVYQAAALSFIVREHKTDINLNVFNTTFSNCNCGHNPIIKISFLYHTSTQIYFKETKILNNRALFTYSNAAVQVIHLKRKLFTNDTKYFGHKVHFVKCHIDGNRMFGHILKLDIIADRSTVSWSKAESILPFNLYVMESTFIGNEVTSGLWTIYFSYASILSLATVTIQSCDFIFNRNMSIKFYHPRKIMFYEQNTFYNNSGNLPLISIDKSDVKGLTKFVCNIINGSSVMAFNNYTNTYFSGITNFTGSIITGSAVMIVNKCSNIYFSGITNFAGNIINNSALMTINNYSNIYFSGITIFASNIINGSALMTVNNYSNIYFSGITIFASNIIDSSSVMTIDNYSNAYFSGVANFTGNFINGLSV